MKIKITQICILLVLFLISCSESENKADDVVDIPVVPVENLASGSGVFAYNYSVTGFSKNINVYYYLPANATPSTPIMFVFHGDERNAVDYRNTLVTKAQQKGVIVIAPEFSEANFPNGNGYNLGNVFTDGDNPSASTLNPEAKWTFSIIEPLFDFVKSKTNNTTAQYSIFGHSAGGQFAHRFLMFKPNSRVEKAVISAPGWYTYANTVIFPYGLTQSSIESLSVSNFLSKKIFVQVGDNDNNPNSAGLRHNVYADAQGLNRRSRATNYFQFNQQLATSNNYTFNWSFSLIDNADHDYVKPAANAMNLLFN